MSIDRILLNYRYSANEPSADQIVGKLDAEMREFCAATAEQCQSLGGCALGYSIMHREGKSHFDVSLGCNSKLAIGVDSLVGCSLASQTPDSVHGVLQVLVTQADTEAVTGL